MIYVVSHNSDGGEMMNITEITTQKPQSKEQIRLAAYCRVSTDSEDQLHSFATQIKYYKDYERKNPQYKLVDIYADEGLSGTRMDKRDEMQRLIRDCKKGKIDRVIVKSVSRFARNTQELLTTIRLLKEIGVSVFFEEQGIDTDKLNMEMIVTFPGMAAQQESVSISENMRWSYKKRMESGEFNCCKAAYGYKLENNQLVINEDEAAVIRRIFKMFLQGVGKQRIASILNSEGIKRRAGMKEWSAQAIVYILNNERYIGDALLQKYMATDTLPFRNIKNHGERQQYYVENSHASIVSKEMFKAVQDLQKERIVKSTEKRKMSILSGLMKCPDCGCSFRRQIIKDATYWLCAGRASGSKECRSIRVKENAVCGAFTKMIYKLVMHRKELFDTLINQFERMRNILYESENEIRSIDKQLADLAAQNQIIAKLHTNGILNAAEYAAKSSELSNTIKNLRAQRRKKLSEDENDEILEQIKVLNDLFADYAPTYEFDEQLFSEIVEKITVDSNDKLTFTLIGGIKFTEMIPEKERCKSL